MQKLTFNEFCNKCCYGLYEPRLSEDEQCSGYLKLKKMVIDKIEPASIEEINRWENFPTVDELFSEPDVKYLRFLHPVLRPYIIENWQAIKVMDVS